MTISLYSSVPHGYTHCGVSIKDCNCLITGQQRYWELTKSSGRPGRGPGAESWQRDFVYLNNLWCKYGSFLGPHAAAKRNHGK